MKRNKILTAALSIAIALGLWFYVVTVVKPDTTNTYYNIPVAFEGESMMAGQGYMIVGGKDTTVTMELHGNRLDLDKVNSGNITLVVDLSRIDSAGEVELPYTHRFPGDVPSGALAVQSKSPDTIKLTVAEVDYKYIDVKPLFGGVAPDADKYIVLTDKVEINNNRIRIDGPKEVINKIDHAMIQIDLTGRTKTFAEEYEIILVDNEGNPVDDQFVTPSVTVARAQVTVESMKYVRLDVADIPGGGATRQTSSFVYDPGNILVSADENVLSKLTKIELGVVDLGKLTKATELEFPIEMPPGVTNRSGEETAKVWISFPNLGVKELTVTKFEALNVPEGMYVEWVTQSLKVTVRGPKDDVAKVLANDVTVTVDFANAVASTASFTPVITVNATKHPNVGAIDDYSISATLQEGVEPASETTTE